ncbi:MAG: recombinase RecA [Clostridiales bacterium]|nr:recombinase RecA [Clostridiales bacterium]MDY6116749.1 recombinase RecA [Anaerovoracaceae bacterium]
MANKKESAKVENIKDRSEEEKIKALSLALEKIEKEYGAGAIMKMGDRPKLNISSIPTGSISLDIATGIGGVPKGRIVEIFGPESSGKTTLTLHIIAEAQKQGGKAAFIDAEHALDPVYARNLGVDIDELLISQPDTGEQGLEICDMLARSGAIDLIVIDSVAALVPKAEILGDMGDSHVGLHARLMSQALRKLTGTINKSGTSVIFINQLREKVGVIYGSPEVTTGGRALKFYSSMRLDVRKQETIKQGDTFLGNRTRVKVVKNKLAAPFKYADFDIMYGQGISRSGDILDCAVDAKIVNKAGSWYSYQGERMGQGRENVKLYFESHPEVLDELYDKVMDTLKPDYDENDDSDKRSSNNVNNNSNNDDPKPIELEVDEDGVVIE